MANSSKELSKPQAEAAEDAATGKPASKAAITGLAKTVGVLDEKLAKLRGEKGAALKTAETDDNVDKAAFKEAMKRKQMTDERREEYQRNVARYEFALGIEYNGDMFKDAGQRAPRAAAART